jgi:hypothetical protein
VGNKRLLDIDGPIAVIANNEFENRNAFDDAMDAARLFEIHSELKSSQEVRAVVLRGERLPGSYKHSKYYGMPFLPSKGTVRMVRRPGIDPQ